MMKENREYLKTYWWEDVFYTDYKTDKQRKVQHPPLQKEYPDDAKIIDLINDSAFSIGKVPLLNLIRQRRSRRKFTTDSISMEEISFLLWATQGVNEIYRQGTATQRTVPSGGSRHPFETYLAVFNVEELNPGLYRYIAIEHRLCFIGEIENLSERLGKACMNQMFVGKSAVTFIWTTIPYRTEWNYDKVSHKIIAQDSGHMCQNLYLAAESIGAGTCAIGAFHQDDMDSLIGVDGDEEFTVYIAPVGKIAK